MSLFSGPSCRGCLLIKVSNISGILPTMRGQLQFVIATVQLLPPTCCSQAWVIHMSSCCHQAATLVFNWHSYLPVNIHRKAQFQWILKPNPEIPQS